MSAFVRVALVTAFFILHSNEAPTKTIYVIFFSSQQTPLGSWERLGESRRTYLRNLLSLHYADPEIEFRSSPTLPFCLQSVKKPKQPGKWKCSLPAFMSYQYPSCDYPHFFTALTHFSVALFAFIVVVVEIVLLVVVLLCSSDWPQKSWQSSCLRRRLQVSHVASSLARSHCVDQTSLKLTEIYLSL